MRFIDFRAWKASFGSFFTANVRQVEECRFCTSRAMKKCLLQNLWYQFCFMVTAAENRKTCTRDCDSAIVIKKPDYRLLWRVYGTAGAITSVWYIEWIYEASIQAAAIHLSVWSPAPAWQTATWLLWRVSIKRYGISRRNHSQLLICATVNTSDIMQSRWAELVFVNYRSEWWKHEAQLLQRDRATPYVTWNLVSCCITVRTRRLASADRTARAANFRRDLEAT